ncbi:hypothetical protein CEP54_015574 [Fusarium duplospermum]|uniref:Uncharacterized protein n=1 Tax=Fusarium duplospermum TaxID=1325734 RepID=A0A428NN39_9HYPO|nr:hypothetical protein CEP54_015574 [Fusarium duplospermum]
MSFAMGYGVIPWIQNLGYQNCFISAAAIGLLATSTFLVMMKWGKVLRQFSSEKYWLLVVQNQNAAVFDSYQYPNEASDHVHTVPLHDHEDPAKIRRDMKQETLNKYKTNTFTYTTAVIAKEEVGVFEVMDEPGQAWKGRKLILAIGCRDILPDIPGIHCLFCRGFEESQGNTLQTTFLIPDELSTQDRGRLLTILSDFAPVFISSNSPTQW